MNRWWNWQARISYALMMVLPSIAQPMSCNLLSASRFNFGAYDPLSTLPTDVQATYILQCIPAHPNERLNLQITVLPTAGTADSLQASGTGKSVRFGFYQDPQRSMAIDANTRIVITDRLSMMHEYPLTIYGRLPAKQNVPAGTYRTSLSFIIQY